MTEEEAKAAPEGTKFVDMVGMPGYKFSMTPVRSGLHRLWFLRERLPGQEGRKSSRYAEPGFQRASRMYSLTDSPCL
jgi:hypothetical protein